MNRDIPHLRIILSVCIAAVVGYAVFSAWAVFYSDDASLRGDVIGTWKSFAVAAFSFWLGSSSGGKTAAADPPPKSAVDAADRTAEAAADKADQIRKAEEADKS